MMAQGKSRFDRYSTWMETLFLWMPASGMGAMVGLIMALLISQAFELTTTVEVAVAWLLSGLVVGLAQWMVLGPRTVGDGRWLLLTAITWALALAAASLSIQVAGLIAGGLFGCILGGVLMAWAQCSALRLLHGGERCWLFAAGVGWSVALLFGLAFGKDYPPLAEGDGLAVAWAVALGLSLVGTATVLGLLLLFPHPEERESRPAARWWF